MSVQPIVALDVGSSKVACLIAMPGEQHQHYEILGSSLIAYQGSGDDGVGEGWPSDVLLLGRTIEQALEATGVSGDFIQAHVTFSHPSLRSETVQGALMLADEPVTIRKHHLELLARSALTQALGIDREALLIERLGCSGNGFEGVRDPHGLVATRLLGTFHVISMPIVVQRTIMQGVESVGLEVASMTYSLIAAAAALSEAHTARRILLIDIGGVSTDIGVFAGGVLLASHTIAWGGITLASSVAKELRLTLEQAMALSLEGLGSARIDVRQCVETPLQEIGRALHKLLKEGPRPDLALVTGRGALIDGIAEWLERTTQIKTSLGRSARLHAMADLSRQVGLSASVGLATLVTASTPIANLPSSRVVDRLLARTKSLLTEYF